MVQMFEFDPLACPACRGPMRMAAGITPVSVIHQILTPPITCATPAARGGSDGAASAPCARAWRRRDDVRHTNLELLRHLPARGVSAVSPARRRRRARQHAAYFYRRNETALEFPLPQAQRASPVACVPGLTASTIGGGLR